MSESEKVPAANSTDPAPLESTPSELLPNAPAHSPPVESPPVISSPPPNATGVEPENYQMLDRRYVTVERIAGLILAAIVTTAGLMGFGIFLMAAWPPNIVHWLILIGLLTLSVLLFVGAIAFPAAEYRYARWRVDESGLEIKRGVFWRREITIPRARVQHTDISQGPLARRYGLAKLVIHTAGTEAAAVELSGLALPIAQWLRDVLIDEVKGRNDAV